MSSSIESSGNGGGSSLKAILDNFQLSAGGSGFTVALDRDGWISSNNFGGLSQVALSLAKEYSGIGISTDGIFLVPTATLDVDGDIRIRSYVENNDEFILTADSNGLVSKQKSGEVIDKNANFNFDIGSSRKIYTHYNAASHTGTILSNTLNVGDKCRVTQMEQGTVTIAAGAGVSIVGNTATSGQYTTITIERLNDNGYGQSGQVYLCS